MNSRSDSGIAYAMADQLDERQIRSMVEGGMVQDHWCYHFNVSGHDVYGIGFSGAKELAKISGGIFADPKTPPVIVSETPQTIKVASYVVLVRDGVPVFGIWGVAEQVKVRVVNGIPKRDEKAFVVAISKAQRNGILSMVREDVKQSAIAQWKKMGKVKVVEAKELVHGGVKTESVNNAGEKSPEEKASELLGG